MASENHKDVNEKSNVLEININLYHTSIWVLKVSFHMSYECWSPIVMTNVTNSETVTASLFINSHSS
jgi:hypothetical protein